MPILDCRHFNGYKPCGKSTSCDDSCTSKSIPSIRILLIHLGAIGAVLRSTALLKSIHRKYPGCHLTWITDSPSHRLLEGNPLIDKVMTSNETQLLELSALEFDVAFVLDKSLKAAGVLRQTHADLIFGFMVESRTGAVLPATEAASELWEIGLDDHLKFHMNRKSEIQLMHEALELDFQNENYFLPLNWPEQCEVEKRHEAWKKNLAQPVIGINTGASPTIPYKKLSIENHRELVSMLQGAGYENLVLLGGPEDTLRNCEIAKDKNLIQSPTDAGLRDGMISVSACDIVISGDSLGMHMGIASQAYVVAWFGPTCAQEIEFFGKGEAILTKADCAPCWKRLCSKTSMCYDQVDLNEIIAAVKRGEIFCRKHQAPEIQEQAQEKNPVS